MACIVFKSDLGERRVPENQPFRQLPGEVQIGIDGGCDHTTITKTQQDVDAKLEAEGLRLGDAIAWVTKRLGIRQCAACQARREILNNVEKVGWAETIKQIKETF